MSKTPAPIPSDIPEYIRDGLERQDVESLRNIMAYCDQLIDEQEAEHVHETRDNDVVDKGSKNVQSGGGKNDSDGNDGEGVKKPDAYSDEEWGELVEEAREEAELYERKGTLTTNTIKGNEYVYLKWSEDGQTKSEYVAPVNPKQ